MYIELSLIFWIRWNGNFTSQSVFVWYWIPIGQVTHFATPNSVRAGRKKGFFPSAVFAAERFFLMGNYDATLFYCRFEHLISWHQQWRLFSRLALSFSSSSQDCSWSCLNGLVLFILTWNHQLPSDAVFWAYFDFCILDFDASGPQPKHMWKLWIVHNARDIALLHSHCSSHFAIWGGSNNAS